MLITTELVSRTIAGRHQALGNVRLQ